MLDWGRVVRTAKNSYTSWSTRGWKDAVAFGLKKDQGKAQKSGKLWSDALCACGGGVELTRSTHLVAAVDDRSPPYHRPLDSWMGRLEILGCCNVGGGGHDHGENLRDERY